MKSRIRFLIFVLLFVITILINMDHGSLPAVTISLQEDLHLSKTSLGALGSCVYIGLTLGSFLSAFIMSKANIKFLIGLAMSLTGLSQIVFPLSGGTLWVMYASRLLSGFSQVFMVVYCPVWVDAFAPEDLQTVWMMLLQIGVPVGMILGYSFTAIFYYFLEWEWSFYIQGFTYFPLAILFQCIPKLEVEITNEEINEFSQVEVENTLKDSISKIGKAIVQLASNKVFVFTMLTISSLYFIVTGIQFWASDYLLNVLNVPKKYIFPTYAITTATGPILGAIFGGIVTHKLGGYKTTSSMIFCLFVGIAAMTCAIPAPFVRDFTIFISFLWIILFCGGAVMPNVTGMMISSVENQAKFTANSVASIATNLLGYLPAPFIYGFVCEYTGGNTSSYGLLVILYAIIFAELSMLFALFAKNPSIKLNTI